MNETSILKLVVEKYARRHGLTMRQVAESLYMSRSSLSMKLSGKRPITLHEAHDFAVLLGISLDALYELVA